MTHRFEWTPAEAAPWRDDILHLQGIPPDVPLSRRIDSLLGAALATFTALAEPRAIAREVSKEEFASVYRGDGRNPHETPLEAIYPRADRLVLFAATIGAPIAAAIRDLFERRELALGSMLDSVASAAADRLPGLAQLQEVATGGSVGLRVLAYSPGYCGWDVTGQRALFAALHPEEVGIRLNGSCLMQPLKSVSGVLVAGPGSVHKFHPTYSFCGTCKEKQCRDRMASVLRR